MTNAKLSSVTADLRHDWTVAEIEAIYTAPLPDLMFRAQTVHRAHHRADEVQGCMLLSIKTGGCPEDCAYCPQSAHYKTGVTRSELVSLDELDRRGAAQREGAGRDAFLHGRRVARRAANGHAVRPRARHGPRRPRPRHGSVLHARHADAGAGRRAGRGRAHGLQPQPRHVARVLRQHHHHAHLRRSARDARARARRPASPSAAAASSAWAKTAAFATACSSSSPRSTRIRRACRSTCSCASTGTPLADVPPEDPLELVRTIATARILMPASFVRLSAGRLSLSDEAQALCFLAGANSVFLGERLLTTPNPGAIAR